MNKQIIKKEYENQLGVVTHDGYAVEVSGSESFCASFWIMKDGFGIVNFDIVPLAARPVFHVTRFEPNPDCDIKTLSHLHNVLVATDFANAYARHYEFQHGYKNLAKGF